MSVEWWSVFFAALALVWSAVTWFRTTGLQRQQNDLFREQNNLQRRIVEIEEARDNKVEVAAHSAAIEISLFKSGISGHRVSLLNRGQATARSMEVYLGDRRIPDKQLPFIDPRSIPESLGPGERAFIESKVDLYDVKISRIVVKWVDELGQSKAFEKDLTQNA